MSYHSIREEVRLFIKEHSLPLRTNCPICGNKNTFGAVILDGQILYNCFHTNCGIRGKLNYDLSLSDIRNNGLDSNRSIYNIQNRTTTSSTTSSSSLVFEIPDYWSSPLQNVKCFRFLKYWNLLDLYASRKIHLYYDCKEDRCVFILLNTNNKIMGAVGRSLDYKKLPKWHVYGRLEGCPFIVHK